MIQLYVHSRYIVHCAIKFVSYNRRIDNLTITSSWPILSLFFLLVFSAAFELLRHHSVVLKGLS